MKKGLMYLLVLLLGTFVFAACSDDDDDPVVPPTAPEIAKTYTAENLQAQIDGKAAPADASVDVVTSSDNSVALKLTNIVPGVKTFVIPNVIFAAQTKSEYYSTLKGAVTDNVLGYTVSAEGTVDNEILSINIQIAVIEGDTKVDAKSFRNLILKGDMEIDVMGSAVTSMQRVYTSRPYKGDSSQIKLEIKNFQFQGVGIGDITLDTLQVEKRGEVYGLQPASRKLSLIIGDVEVNVRGAFVTEGEDISLQLNLMIDASPLTVFVDFDGKAEKESTDTNIEITFEDEHVVEQPNNSKTASIYKFKVWESDVAGPLMLTPKVKLPAGATLDSIVVKYDDGTKAIVSEGTALDFSKLKKANAVTFWVTAEDIREHKGKFLTMEIIPEANPVYTMENWISSGSYEEPEGLTTSNSAAVFFPMFGIITESLPIEKGSDNAAVITTLYSVSPITANTLIPAITAGTLFTGEFEVDMENTLKSTHFGIPYRKKPKSFKISYKYTPGTTFYQTVKKDSLGEENKKVEYNTAEIVSGETDECSINAYLYEVSSYEETLDGSNINTSDKVIMKAVLADGSAKADYVEQTIDFVGTGKGEYSANKKYKLAIVCSSSKKGDQFMGAPGSQLSIRHLEVISE